MVELREKLCVVLDQGVVAFACRSLKPFSVEDMYLATGVADEFSPPEHASSDTDSASAHPKHVGELLMSETKMIGVGTVMRHQQPPRQTWLDLVEVGADGELRQLRHQHVKISLKCVTQRWTAAQLLS